MRSDRQRKELAEYTDRNGGTLERWLQRAEHEGFVVKEAVLDEGHLRAKYSLACWIPKDLREVVNDRGGHGPRDKRQIFADTAAVHYWDDTHSFNQE